MDRPCVIWSMASCHGGVGKGYDESYTVSLRPQLTFDLLQLSQGEESAIFALCLEREGTEVVDGYHSYPLISGRTSEQTP